MIGYLKGKIIKKTEKSIIIEINQIGYSVFTNKNILSDSKEDSEIELFIHSHIKEDIFDLYGFKTYDELEFFKILLSISGIGPKLAQSILSGIQIDDLREALATGNLGRITAIPGVGKKTGQRLLVELKDKVEKISGETEVDSGSQFSIRNDAVSALTNLGYSRKIAENAIRDIINNNPESTIEELIKDALVKLNK